ncbi:MAG: hypothetical protein QOF48_3003 [Verrucomicrobiota bacterium]
MKSKSIFLTIPVVAALAFSANAGEWITLFDGKPTTQLRGYRMKEFPTNNWVIEDGALKTVPGKAVDLVSVDKFENFELEFEWKVAPGGNSGVMYHVAETGSAPYNTGPEYQVLDDDKHGDGKNPLTSAGSLYALIAPNKSKSLKPVGEFNSTRIVFNKGHVEHWLNGKKVVEYQWGSDEVKALVAKSKFAGMKDFMSQNEGYVDFQHHGQEAWFRNIRIRKL